jgi:hypothetical protein
LLGQPLDSGDIGGNVRIPVTVIVPIPSIIQCVRFQEGAVTNEETDKRLAVPPSLFAQPGFAAFILFGRKGSILLPFSKRRKCRGPVVLEGRS